MPNRFIPIKEWEEICRKASLELYQKLGYRRKSMVRSTETIWVIALEGPEWYDVSEARRTKKEAEQRCRELNYSLDQKKNKTVIDSLSEWTCKPVGLRLNGFVLVSAK